MHCAKSDYVYFVAICLTESCLLQLRGNARLLQRSVHACVLHPTQAQSLLVYAGYGREPDGSTLVWQDDLVVLKLDT